jgi:6-pyruvoyltetrahydropterin/6-carboxytetrahydropterin synthase
MYEISKDFIWDMGHRISQHGGKCYSPHGHTYKATIYVKATKLDDLSMVLDFGTISERVAPIIEKLDHAFMLFMHDSIMMSFFQRETGFKILLVPFESTAENIAWYLYDEIRKQIPNISKVVVWETAKCKATYYNERA